jgi:hypothetical protein
MQNCIIGISLNWMTLQEKQQGSMIKRKANTVLRIEDFQIKPSSGGQQGEVVHLVA